MFRKDSNISVEFKSNTIYATLHFDECSWVPLPSEGKSHLCSLVDEQLKHAISVHGINGRPFPFLRVTYSHEHLFKPEYMG